MPASERVTLTTAWVGCFKASLPPKTPLKSIAAASVSKDISSALKSSRMTSPRPLILKLSMLPCKSLLEGWHWTKTSTDSLRVNRQRIVWLATVLSKRSPQSLPVGLVELVRLLNIEVCLHKISSAQYGYQGGN